MDLQRWIYEGRQLDDNATVVESNLRQKAIIDLVWAQRED